MMKVYKPIAGFEGLYEIADDGEVISLYGNKRKALKPGLMTAGYQMVNLKKDKKQKNFSVHRLIATHFIDNPDSLEQVNHKDGNKLNNSLDNLEWISRSGNVQHAYDTGLKTYRPLHYKGKSGKDHNRSIQIRCVETGKIYGSQSEAVRELNLGTSSISWAVKTGRPIFNRHYEKVNA